MGVVTVLLWLTLSRSLLSQIVIFKMIFFLLTITECITMLILMAQVILLLRMILMELLLMILMGHLQTKLVMNTMLRIVIMRRMYYPSTIMGCITLAQNPLLLVVPAIQLLYLLLLLTVTMKRTHYPSITMVFITMEGL